VTEIEKAQYRNEVIEEMCGWLEACIAQVDHASETFQSCSAMVKGLRNKKTAVPETLEGEHYPLTQPPARPVPTTPVRTGFKRQ
jgi:hypothetical protein